MASLYDYEVRTPLRFRSNNILLNKNKKGCKNTCDFTLLNPFNYLMDFVICRELSGVPINSFNILDENGAIVQSLSPTLIKVFPYFDKEYLVFNGIYNDNGKWIVVNGGVLNLECNKTYTVQIIDKASNTWNSEPIKLFRHNNTYQNTEFVTDGTFDQGNTYWDTTQLGTATLAGGLYCGTSLANESYISQSLGSIAINNGYVVIEITYGSGGSIPTGWVTAYLNNDPSLGCTYEMVSGSHTSYCLVYVGQGTQNLTITVGLLKGTTGCIENVSLKESSTESDCHIKLEWDSSCWIGNYPPNSIGGSIINRYWFPYEVELGDPEYKTTVEGKENGEKDFTPTFTKRVKEFTLHGGLVPEYIIDAIIDMKLHENKRLYYKNNIGYNNIKDITAAYDWWQEEVCYAELKINMDIDDTIVKYGCCNDDWIQCWSCSTCENQFSQTISKTGARIFDINGQTILQDIFNPVVSYYPVDSETTVGIEDYYYYAQDGSTSLFYYDHCHYPDPCDIKNELITCNGITGKYAISSKFITATVDNEHTIGYTSYESNFIFKDNKWVPAIGVELRNKYSGLTDIVPSGEMTIKVKPVFPEMDMYPLYDIYYVLNPTDGWNTWAGGISKHIIKQSQNTNLFSLNTSGQETLWFLITAYGSNCCQVSSPVWKYQIGRRAIYNNEGGVTSGNVNGMVGFLNQYYDLAGHPISIYTPIYDEQNAAENIWVSAWINMNTPCVITAIGSTIYFDSINNAQGSQTAIYQLEIDSFSVNTGGTVVITSVIHDYLNTHFQR